MECQSCGGSLRADAKFCGACGAPVETAEPVGLCCPTCGVLNPLGAKFCQRDGTPLLGAMPSHNDGVMPAAPSQSPRWQRSEAGEPLGHAGRSRWWLALGAALALTAAGGGYWWYTNRGAPTVPADLAQTPTGAVAGSTEAGVTVDDTVEVPLASESEATTSTPIEVAQAPRVSVGDRWVTEVVDHQDAALSYRAERTVTDVSQDRIFTAVRTLGKDYVRVVEYTGGWALVATHLRSGATTTYSPALPYMGFPLEPGKTWAAQIVETDAEGRQRMHDVRAKAESWETVQVPAGTFRALKIVLTDDISTDGVVVQQGRDVSWYAPNVRRTVKTEETSFDPATGETRQRTISLLEYSVGGPETLSEERCRDHRDRETFRLSGGEAAELVLPGERCLGFAVGADGTVTYRGARLGQLDVSYPDFPYVALLMSPPSKRRGWRYAVLWDGESGGGLSAYIVDSNAIKVVIRRHDVPQSPDSTASAIHSAVGSAIRWSPGESRAVVPAIGEVQNVVAGIDLETGALSAIYIRGLERDACDTQTIDVKDSRWLSETRFQFKVHLSPNPWADQREGYRPGMCDSPREFPDYRVTVDLNSMSVVSTE